MTKNLRHKRLVDIGKEWALELEKEDDKSKSRDISIESDREV